MHPKKASEQARIAAGIEDERAMSAGHSIDLIRGMRIGLATGAAAVRMMRGLKIGGAALMVLAMTSTIAAVEARAELDRIRMMPFEDAVRVLQSTMRESEAREASEVVRLKVADALAELRRVERMMPASHAANARAWIIQEATR